MFGACFNIGRATNNYAEYSGLYFCLILNTLLGRRHLAIFSDSTLVVGQVKGNMKVRHPILKEVIKQVHQLVLLYDEIELNYMERELNTAADHFAKHSVNMDQDYKYVYSLQEIVSSIDLS